MKFYQDGYKAINLIEQNIEFAMTNTKEEARKFLFASNTQKSNFAYTCYAMAHIKMDNLLHGWKHIED